MPPGEIETMLWQLYMCKVATELYMCKVAVMEKSKSNGVSEATRAHVVAVADRLIEHEGPQVPLTRIAKAAGVSRQTLYLLFRGRVGLFQALWQLRLGGDRTEMSTLKALGPLEAFETLYRQWIRRAIKAEKAMRPLWMVDDHGDLMRALREADDGAMTAYRLVFGRLQRAGCLRDIWTSEEAADAAWQHALYLVFVGHVRRMRAWTPREIEERGMKVLRAAFLTDEAAQKAAKIDVPR
jgi:AcrR family transcriptional regulator